jgi:ribosome maturation factor RimP
MTHRGGRGPGRAELRTRRPSANVERTNVERTTARQPTGDPARARNLAPIASRLRRIIEPVVTDSGYYLEDLRLSRVGRRYIVRLTVDRDAGLDLDAVATLSGRVSTALDSAEQREGEVLPGEYELEVSSPGVDRPLTLPRHWHRNLGRLVSVRAEGRQLTGRVRSADDDGVVLELDGAEERLPYSSLGPGRVQLEFSHAEGADDRDLPEDRDGAP